MKSEKENEKQQPNPIKSVVKKHYTKKQMELTSKINIFEKI
jgi:hypothetical protein